TFLKEILPVWIISLFDQNKDVARVANESFQATFPPEKRVDVLVFGREKILSYITDIILYKTSETLSDPRFTSKEDMVSKYLKVVASLYYSLAHIISQLKEDESHNNMIIYDDFKNNDDNNNLENNFKDDNYSENNDDDDNFENKNDDYDFKSNNNDNDFEDENVSSIPLQSET
ncbi:17719_t:CDS:2, partial [Rhizophagus irregularis]